jgi:hypothetical protein
MKKLLCCIATAIMLAVTASTALAAAIGCREFARSFDPATMETVAGDVLKVNDLTPIEGVGAGVCLMLKTEKETLPVHLGPQWVTQWGSHVMERIEGKIVDGDRIQVTGSRVTLEGTTVLVASEVKKGEEILLLRTKKGTPVWSSWNRK